MALERDNEIVPPAGRHMCTVGHTPQALYQFQVKFRCCHVPLREPKLSWLRLEDKLVPVWRYDR